MSYIEFKNVDKEYKMGEITIKVLDNTNFEIEKGELVVIVGSSGAGKTTTLNILGGMDSCTRGKVKIANRDITNYNRKQLTEYRRNDIGFVFKEKEYNENLQEFEEKEPDATKEINENEEKLNDIRKKLDELSMHTYSVYNKRELPGGEGYKIYETVSEMSVGLLVLFFIIIF